MKFLNSLIKTKIELSIIRTNKMDDLIITKCQECGRWTYRYNYQQCPICLDKREREKLEKLKLELNSSH